MVGSGKSGVVVSSTLRCALTIVTTTFLFCGVQYQVIRHSVNDKVTVIGAGVTLHEVLAAAADLSKEGQEGVFLFFGFF